MLQLFAGSAKCGKLCPLVNDFLQAKNLCLSVYTQHKTQSLAPSKQYLGVEIQTLLSIPIIIVLVPSFIISHPNYCKNLLSGLCPVFFSL